jgi:hypothetical protein
MNDVTVFVLLPEEFLPNHVKSVGNIYRNRAVLREMLSGEYVVSYLIDALVDALEHGTKFRTLDCLRVIRAILCNDPFGVELSSDTISKLFYLYRTFVFQRSKLLERRRVPAGPTAP